MKQQSAPILKNIVVLAFGIALVVICSQPNVFRASILKYILGAILICGGAYHYYMLLSGYKPVIFPGWFYVMPTLIVVTGGVILFAAFTEATMFMVLGIGLILYAITGFLEAWALRLFNRSVARSGTISKSETPQQ